MDTLPIPGPVKAEMTRSHGTYLQKHCEQALTDHLKDQHCTFTIEESFVELTCTLCPGQEDFRRLLKAWPGSVQAAVREFVEDNVEDTHLVVKDGIWDNLIEFLQSGAFDDSKIVVETDYAQRKITFTGAAATVGEKLAAARQKHDQIDRNNKKRKVTKQFVSQELELALPGVQERIMEMQANYSDAEIKLFGTIVEVEAVPEDKDQIYVDIYETLAQIPRHKIGHSYSEECVCYASDNDAIRTNINNQIMSAGIEASWKLKRHELVICITEGEYRKVRDIVFDIIDEQSIDFDEEDFYLLHGRQWINFQDDITEQYDAEAKTSDVTFNGKKGSQIVYGLEGTVKVIVKKINNFIEDNVVRKKSVHCSAMDLKFILKHRQVDIHNLEREFALKIDLTGDTQIKLTGPRTCIEMGEPAVKHLLAKMVKQDHTNRDSSMFTDVEAETECLIKLPEEVEQIKNLSQASRATPENVKLSGANYMGEPVLEPGQSSGGITVTIVKDELGKQRADILVAATSNNLKLDSGAAGKNLVQVGGYGLQKECDNHGGIQHWEIAVINGGKLRCSKVYLISLQPWSGPGSKRNLKKVIIDCLKMASQHSKQSISFAAMGTGQLKYPAPEVASAMFQAVNEFNTRTPNTTLKEVRFVLYPKDKDTIRAFTDEEQNTGQGGGYTSRAEMWWSRGIPEVTVGPMKVQLVVEKIEEQKVDCLLVATNETMNMNSGACRALLLKGGSGLQDECKSKYGNNLQVGQVAEITGGKLSCKSVYLTVLPPPKEQLEEELIRIVTTFLGLAQSKKYTSAAIPALGTGFLKYPKDVTCCGMYTAVANWAQSNPSTCLKNIRFVMFEKDTETIEVFQKKFKQRKGSGKGSRKFDHAHHKTGARFPMTRDAPGSVPTAKSTDKEPASVPTAKSTDSELTQLPPVSGNRSNTSAGPPTVGHKPFSRPPAQEENDEDRNSDTETHIDGELPPNAVVIANTSVINGDDKHLSVYRGQVIFLQENQLKGGKEELKAETNNSYGLININSISELEMSCLQTAPNIITDDLLPHCLSGTFFIYLEANKAHFVYNKVGTVYHEKLDLSGLSSDLEILDRVQNFILKNRSIFLFYIDDDSATYCNQFLNNNRHINKDGKLSPYIPDWYHGYAGEDHAKKVLADKQKGSFVVVKGRSLESYILLVTDGTVIHYIPIVEKGGHVAICNKSKQYDSVTDLVEHCFVTPLFIETDDKPAEIFLQRGVSRHEKDIPDGFSTLDPYWTELYMQTLSEGKEKQTSIRLMIVGHEKIGKTTLSRNLMDKVGEEITSTDGIEVHIDTCIIGDCGMWKKAVTSNEDSEMFERIGRMMQSNKKSKQDSNTSATAIKNQAKNKQTHDLDEMKAVPKNTKAETSAENSKGKMSDDMSSRQTTNHQTVDDNTREHQTVDVNTREHQTVDDSSREKEIVLPIGNASKIIALSKSIGNSAEKTVSIWDFGGQYIYYATHQLFHSPRAVYLLVLDLSKDLDERVDVENPFGNIREGTRDVQSFIKFWMHSIHTFVGSKSGEPPVILVGTHKDKIEGLGKSSDEYSETYFDNVRKLFDDTPLLLNHIQHEQFFLDNLTTDTTAFDELRATIMEVAERQSCCTQEFPARWVQLEYALKEVRQPHLKFSQVCEIDSKSEVPIAKIDNIRLFLMFHHFQGNLVFFNENELNDFVILNPQWLIDAFKSIITSGTFCKRSHLRRLWQDFEKTGILTKQLIKEVWEHNENHEFFKDKDMILKFFVRLGIISRCRSYDDGSGDENDDDDDGCGGGGVDCDGNDGDDLYNYIVPSLLPVMQTEHTIKNLIENTTWTDLNLVFRFESLYISPTIYHRTTAAAMGRWTVVKYCDTRILYGNIGMYTLDVHHVGLTRLTDRTIELSVYNLNGNSVKGQVADCFRRFIAKVIKHELNRFHSENISQFKTVFRCACTSEDRFEYMTIQELKSLGRKPCLLSSPRHPIDGRNSLRQWYPDTVTLSKGNDGTVVDKPLDDRDIGELAKAVGKNWTILGASLGLSPPALERIEMDHSSSTLMQIWHMFKEWKKKVGSSATIETLVDKMKANESLVTIDWDIVQDVLDRCESDYQKVY